MVASHSLFFQNFGTEQYPEDPNLHCRLFELRNSFPPRFGRGLRAEKQEPIADVD